MRRSKSDPAKYARNYRKISQRKMTEQDVDIEKEEIERLKHLLRTSADHLSQNIPDKDEPKNRKRNRKHEEIEKKAMGLDVEEDNKEEKNHYTGSDEIDMILPSGKKKTKKKQVVELTPEELKAAKAKHKAIQRKLNQIQDRHERKKRRTELYATLSEHALSETEMKLMARTAHMGKKVSKKEALKRLLQRERAGIALTDQEKEMLYTNKEVDEDEYDEQFGKSVGAETTADNDATLPTQSREEINEDEIEPLAFSSSGKKKKKKKSKKKSSLDGNSDDTKEIDEQDIEMETESTSDSKAAVSAPKVEVQETAEAPTVTPNLSFAAQMMAGLSSLKTAASEQKKELDKQRAREEAELEEEKLRKEEEERKKRKAYVPKDKVILKCPAVMGMKPTKEATGKDGWRVLSVDRPEEVAEKRYDLPVSAMEYEIIDSIRNKSVTIICSETGSGKSTQVPQFLYESGITLGNARARGEDDGLLICVTQPRRVAAVSTAKRVCYEMGHSKDKGQSIQGKRGEGNTVAYQTKYETAGLGPKTRIKFMTDGILLQEIKTDLLLRKYAGTSSSQL